MLVRTYALMAVLRTEGYVNWTLGALWSGASWLAAHVGLGALPDFVPLELLHNNFAVGFGLGVGALGAYLAGAIGTGTLMAVFLSNTGGAWDNAKKMVEDGHHGGKGSDAHHATIVGDTVGDPFKDTAGPAINPLIKVMNLVAVLVTPAIVHFALNNNDTMNRVIATVAAIIIAAQLFRARKAATSIA